MRSRKFFIVLLSLFSLQSFAGPFSGIMDTADPLRHGKFFPALETFIGFNGGGQFNPILHLGYGLGNDADVDVVMGTGSAEFQFGAAGKWNLFPDTEGQVGFSLGGGAKYVHSGISFFLLECYPVVSKRFDVKGVGLTPYASFQTDISFNSIDTTVPLNIVFGARVVPPNWKTIQLFTEVGISVHNSAHYLSLQVALDMDDLTEWDSDQFP